MSRACEIIPPNYWDDLGSERSGCPLPAGHDGPHQSVTSRRGAITWEDDYECECCTDADERCIVWFPLAQHQSPAEKASPEGLCEGCPPVGYPTDKTRCSPCPRRAQHQSPQSSEPPPFRLFDRVKRRGQVGDAMGSVMAMQQFDHGWEVWVHVAAYSSNAIIKADDLIFVSHRPANLELTAEKEGEGDE